MKVCVVFKEGVSVVFEEIIVWIKEYIVVYKYLREVEIMDVLLMMVIGKILKKELWVS